MLNTDAVSSAERHDSEAVWGSWGRDSLSLDFMDCDSFAVFWTAWDRPASNRESALHRFPAPNRRYPLDPFGGIGVIEPPPEARPASATAGNDARGKTERQHHG